MRRAAEYLALGLSAAIGVALLAVPEIFGIGGPARLSQLVVGPIAASVAVISMSAVARPFVRVNVALGAWLVAAAVLFDHGGAWYVSAAAGAGLAVLAFVPRSHGERFGGGWGILLGAPGGSGEDGTTWTRNETGDRA